MTYYELWQQARYGNLLPSPELEEDPETVVTTAEQVYAFQLENPQYIDHAL